MIRQTPKSHWLHHIQPSVHPANAGIMGYQRGPCDERCSTGGRWNLQEVVGIVSSRTCAQGLAPSCAAHKIPSGSIDRASISQKSSAENSRRTCPSPRNGHQYPSNPPSVRLLRSRSPHRPAQPGCRSANGMPRILDLANGLWSCLSLQRPSATPKWVDGTPDRPGQQSSPKAHRDFTSRSLRL